MDAELDRPLPIDPEHRSPDPATCPFLRAVDDDGRVGLPIEAVDPRNRCVATRTADPQDAAQQRRACLVAAHVSCPRYLSGVAGPVATARAPDHGPSDLGASGAGQARARPGRGTRTLTPAVLAASVFLVASASAAIAFVALRGGIDLPIASPGASEVALASPTGAATAESSSLPSPTADASTSPTTAPTPSQSVAATPVPTATPTATSDRYALLEPCPSTPDCYIYTVRAGDNLKSIANYFGVPYQTVLDMNPQITDPATIRRGDQITLPPPTR